MSATDRPFDLHADPLWARLAAYRIGPPDAALPFEARLARGNGWTLPHAARVVEEYRRFCFLAATCCEEVTPSDAVDQAWHLHLTYTRDYWERFCPGVLGRAFHHGPTAGGAGERHRFFEQYARTLRRYEEAFGRPAPLDIWPGAARRLIDDPRARRVHPRDAVVLPQSWLRAAAAVGAVVGLALMVT